MMNQSVVAEENHCELTPIIEVSPGLFLHDVTQPEPAILPTTANFLIPPLTLWGLMSLDYHRVFMDVQLLHDVYMNPKKPFKIDVRQYPTQPLEGRYWFLLNQDIELIRLSLASGHKAKCSQRLVILLQEVKDMVKDVLGSSKPDMDQYYDVEIMVAEIETGQFMVEGYARLLHSVLGLNPSLTISTWEMLQQLINPALHSDMTLFLQRILQLLETIKTERMFHQLGVLRPAMLENLLMLERQHWDGQNGNNLSETKKSLISAKEANDEPLKRMRKNEQTFFIFSKSISDLIVDEHEPVLPESFSLDEENIDRQRESARLLILTALGLGILRQLTGEMRVSQKQIDDFKESLFFVFKQNRFTPSRMAIEAESIIVRLAEEIYHTRLSYGNRAMARNLCRDILTDPMNPFRLVIISRLKDHLVDLMWKRARPGIAGYNGVQRELEALSEAFTRMAFLNWNVHKDRYEKMCQS